MYNGIYGQHLLDTLKKHEVNTIQTIPQHIENQVLLTTRNQELTKLKKNPDHYEEIIHNWLEEKEQTVERRWIKNEEIQGIETIFLQGHIDNLELFYRFEQLKQKNRIEDIKRGYVYGRRCGVCSEVTNETKTMDFIGGASFHSIFVHFHHNKGNIQQEL
ncbi:MAG: hypothetical protein LBI53_02335 [Candidatus Peribacteria bacterium]|jgi:hypothetical protein|nr:hypothetical protein [Candidatus Peribacteria bacterium]